MSAISPRVQFNSASRNVMRYSDSIQKSRGTRSLEISLRKLRYCSISTVSRRQRSSSNAVTSLGGNTGTSDNPAS
jgi:hypothetical protein